MIGYVTVGTNDLERAVTFYDGVFEVLGAQRFMEEETFVAWSVAPDKPGFSVTYPYDGKPATVGNGTMVALALDSAENTSEKEWVLAHVDMDYVDELFYGNDVEIAITDVKVGNTSLTVECAMHQDNRLAVKGRAVLVRMDMASRTKQRIPDSIREAIAGR